MWQSRGLRVSDQGLFLACGLRQEFNRELLGTAGLRLPRQGRSPLAAKPNTEGFAHSGWPAKRTATENSTLILTLVHRRRVDWLLPPRLASVAAVLDGCCEKIHS